jgi:hypothetical protein
MQPWPFRIELWQGGTKCADQITAPRKLAGTPHSPFSRGIVRGPNKKRRGTRNSVIRQVARFFDRQTAFSEQLGHLFFLFRAAGADSVNLHIETMALCSLLEGLVNALFDELQLEAKLAAEQTQISEFLALRNRLVESLKKEVPGKSVAAQRLIGLLGHAEPMRLREKYIALCSHFGLNYEKEMKEHFNAWQSERNPLMHGKWEFRDTDFLHQSLIAGAINILFLKLVGYSGTVRAITFGGSLISTYRKI